MQKWKIREWDIDVLSAHPKNPRQLSKSQHKHLKQSLDKFGLIEKPIVNLDGQIIGGHQRVRILREQGEQRVYCWTPDKPLDSKAVDELVIRLNANTGEWDDDILANEWDLAELEAWGLEGLDFGINTQDLGEDLAKDLEKPEKVCPHCGEKLG